jgi:hypothetical protein
VASSKTHAHIDKPSEAQLKRLVDGKDLVVRRLYLETHQLVLKTLPDVVFSVDCDDAQIGYGARQYGYNGWGMAALSPYTKWVSLGFIRGAALDDPDGLLEGTGASVRHIKIKSVEQLSAQKTAIRRMLKSAAKAAAK